MAGDDTCRGINFQYACGVAFLVNCLIRADWATVQFEGQLDIEDVCVFGRDGGLLLRAQIKQKSEPERWEPHEWKAVFSVFAQCEVDVTSSQATVYQLHYAGWKGPALARRIQPILDKVHAEGERALTSDDVALLEEHLGNDVARFVCAVGRRLETIRHESRESVRRETLRTIRSLVSGTDTTSLQPFTEVDAERLYAELFHVVAMKSEDGNPYHRCIRRDEILAHLGLEKIGMIQGDIRERNSSGIPGVALSGRPYPFIGRAAFLRELRQRLCDDGTGLGPITLFGLPGVGKTELARELVRDTAVQADFADGILWAGVGRSPDIAALLGEWARAVGIPQQELSTLSTIESRAKAVQARIGPRRMLLIIDDAWQTEAVQALLVGGPRCVHLVTTRSPAIAEEIGLGGAVNVPELTRDDAFRLLEYLAPVAVRTAPDEVERLLEDINGLPLEIVLVGRYLCRRSRPLRRLDAALRQIRDTRERLRIAHPQAPADRHPSLPLAVPLSLEATIEVSVEALDVSARQALYALAAFAPKPNTFAEAAALASTQGSAEALDELCDSGLLEVSDDGRYTLHQAIADYARVHRDDASAEARMASYFSDFVHAHEADFAALDRELTNITEALRVASEQRLDTIVVRCALDAYKYFEWRGLAQLIARYHPDVLRATASLGDAFDHEFALYQAGRAAIRRGAYEDAGKALNAALMLALDQGAVDRVVNILGNLCDAYLGVGDTAKAERYAREGLALARQQGDTEDIVVALSVAGAITHRGKSAEAEGYLREAVDLARSLPSYEGMSRLLTNLAQVVYERHGDGSSAMEMLRESLELAKAVEHYEHALQAQVALIRIASEEGCAAEAEATLRDVLETFKPGEYHLLIRPLVAGILYVASACEDRERAKEYLQVGLMLTYRDGQDDLAAGVLINLGALAVEACEHAQAQHYFGEALQIALRHELHWLAADALGNLGELAIVRDEPMAARAAYEQCLEHARASSAHEREYMALFKLGWLANAGNEFPRAETYWEQALEVAHAWGDRKHELALLLRLTAFALSRQESHKARAWFRRGVGLARSMDDRQYAVAVIAGLGADFAMRQNLRHARTCQREAVRLARRLETSEILASCLHNLARTTGALGNTVEAKRVGQECLNLLELLGDERAAEIARWLAAL